MLKTFAVAAALALSFQVAAEEATTATTTSTGTMGMQWGATAGVNMTTLKSTGLDYDSTTGFSVGAQTLMSLADWTPGLSLRTGLNYTQINGEGKATGTTMKIKSEVSYLEIPVTALYAFNEMWSMFGGFNLDVKAADKCTFNGVDCGSGVDYKSMVYTFNIGPRVTFAGNHNVEAVYTFGLSPVASSSGQDTEIDNSYGAAYSYMF